MRWQVKCKNNLNWIRIENMTFTLHKYLQYILHIRNISLLLHLKATVFQARAQLSFLPACLPVCLSICLVATSPICRSFVSSFTFYGHRLMCERAWVRVRVCVRFWGYDRTCFLLLIKFHLKKKKTMTKKNAKCHDI